VKVRLRDKITDYSEAHRLSELRGQTKSVHVFDPRQVSAVDTALACNRPLLVRGEPGTGKSQLARAAAKVLGRAFVSVFVDASTRAQDLLWRHDAVTRLADAQVPDVDASRAERARSLARSRYVVPGPVWWALNWRRANEHIQEKDFKLAVSAPDVADDCSAEAGVVLLIDEIDKADTSVPNGLLEVLGQGTFTVPGIDAPIHAGSNPPLVVLTTNEDRVLPDAFIRRCIVLHLRVPDEDIWEDCAPGSLCTWLIERGGAHFEGLSDGLLEAAAEQVIKDRRAVRSSGHCPPGLAEYLDLLRAVTDGGLEGAQDQVAELAAFVLRKHADPRRRREGWRR